MSNQAITLTAGMRSNLFNLQSTNSLMERTQGRLASGKKVNSALDNPVSFFTAKSHTERADDLSGRKDEMSESIQLLKAADAGVEAIVDLIASAKSIATAALSAESTTEIATLQGQYNEVLNQIDFMKDDAFYKGTNLLDDDDSVVKFDEAGTSQLTLEGFDASAVGLAITDAAAWDDTTATGTPDATAIDADIALLDTATQTLRTESSKLSTNLSIITNRQDFTQGMMNVLKDGAAALTNADMNEEGANMLMLQTRQALGTTSLSMASQAAQSVLRLF